MYTRSAVFRVNAGSEPDSPTPAVFRRNTATSPWKLDAFRTLAPGAPRPQAYTRAVRRLPPHPLSLVRVAGARRSPRRILPLIVFGSSANSRRRTRLYGASCSRAYARIDSAVSRVGSWPGAKATYAFG